MQCNLSSTNFMKMLNSDIFYWFYDEPSVTLTNTINFLGYVFILIVFLYAV